MLFHSAPGYVSSFHDDEGNVYCAVPAFKHSDADLARDPLSTNRRLVNSDELELFGTMVVAGATSDHIKVLIPDTFSGPTLNASSPVVLQHVVGLTSPTHIYCFYSCCSSRPETDAVVDPQQRVTPVPTNVARRGCSGPQCSASGSGGRYFYCEY